MTQSGDYEIVLKCLKGDINCFEELVTRYKKLVYSIIYSRIKDREEVDDLSQEVFIKIFKALDRYNPEYKFSTWAASIAVNMCLDRLRKKRAESVSLDEIEYMASDKSTPEDQFLNEERSEALNTAINKLPEKYQQPVILFHQIGLSYEEIMKIMNEPMSIVKNRLYRARHMLRSQLEPARKEEAL